MLPAELVTEPPFTLPELPVCAVPPGVLLLPPFRLARLPGTRGRISSRAARASRESEDGMGDAKTWLVEIARTLSARREVRMMGKCM